MDYLVRAVYSGFTLYMMLVLLRWLGGWVSFETDYGRWRWIAMLTDPVLGGVRRVLPNLGPVDFGPMVTIFALWILRGLAIALLIAAAA